MKKYLFFAMPKTGSSFLCSLLTQKLGDEIVIQNHAALERDGRIYVRGLDSAHLWRFCFVRNPYSRFVSAYRWLISPRGKMLNKYDVKARNAILQYGSLRDFCLNLEEFTSNPDNSPIHFYPQYKWITNDNGKLTMDYVGKYETMDESWKFITSKLLIDYQPINNKHRYSLKYKLKHMKNKLFDLFHPYRDVPLVHDFYKKDFELFGYSDDIDTSNFY